MAQKLSDFFKTIQPTQFGFGSNFSFSPTTQTLPTGQTYPGVTTTKTPIVPASFDTSKMTPGTNPDILKLLSTPGGMSKIPTTPIFNGGGATTTPAPTPTYPPQYINPATGGFYTPEQVAANITKSIPGGSTYDIPRYAGDVLTQGPQTTEQLTQTAAGLTNVRNAIATGQTDPYAAASQSGVAYSPEEMAAIEKAYAGVYDPAINTALDKLTQRQKREDITFQTNESIREAAAKKGITAGGALGLVRGADGYVDPNEYMKKAYAYEAAGKNIKEFLLDYPPAQYINPAAIGTLPSYLQPKLSDKTNAELVAEVRKELTRPEIKALTDEEKALIIARDYGLDPVTFGIYGSGYGSY